MLLFINKKQKTVNFNMGINLNNNPDNHPIEQIEKFFNQKSNFLIEDYIKNPKILNEFVKNCATSEFDLDKISEKIREFSTNKLEKEIIPDCNNKFYDFITSYKGWSGGDGDRWGPYSGSLANFYYDHLVLMRITFSLFFVISIGSLAAGIILNTPLLIYIGSALTVIFLITFCAHIPYIFIDTYRGTAHLLRRLKEIKKNIQNWKKLQENLQQLLKQIEVYKKELDQL
jgi:hypothetical protein